MARLLAGILTAVALGGLAGCAQAPSAKTAALPPTPASVTKKNPGGDASDPERAALERLVTEAWGVKDDRYGTLKIPLVDSKHWQRVKLWKHPTRAAFRFGDDHYGIVVLWYRAIEGKNDPETCLTKFLADAAPEAQAFGARVTESRRVQTTQIIDGDLRPMVIEFMDGTVDSVFDSNDYVGALASYQSWPGTCLVQGVAVTARKHRDLAVKVRDRWVNEGAQRLRWFPALTAAPPTKAR